MAGNGSAIADPHSIQDDGTLAQEDVVPDIHGAGAVGAVQVDVLAEVGQVAEDQWSGTFLDRRPGTAEGGAVRADSDLIDPLHATPLDDDGRSPSPAKAAL